METKRLRMMVFEIFKTLNNLNPVFMKDIFHYSSNVNHKKHNRYIHTQNTTKFGNESLRAFSDNRLKTTRKHIHLSLLFLDARQCGKNCLYCYIVIVRIVIFQYCILILRLNLDLVHFMFVRAGLKFV